jgi:phytoene dehydrogenase-like protein
VRRRAVVIGSGPNGLVGAIELARAGLSVEVHEAAAEPGGGLRSADLTLPGFVHDVCSGVHPLAVASPALRDLDVDWVHPEAPAAHPLDDGSAVVLERSVDATAEQLGRDAAAYRALVAPLTRAWPEISALRPWQAARALGVVPVRDGISSASGLAGRLFAEERTRAFFAGHAAHSILPLERRPSAGIGLALITMGHTVGWPFPRGGARRLADALVGRLAALGGELCLESPVDELPRADVVLADVAPRELARISLGRLPERYDRALRRYRHGPGAFKLDWALRAPIPWLAEGAARAGTVHLGGTFAEIAESERAAWAGRSAARPFVIVAQHGRFDSSRGQTAWAYCHVPNGSAEDMTEAIEAQLERFAPGFGQLVLARHAIAPSTFEEHNRNLVGGDLANGAMGLGRLLFRPTRRLVPYRVPLRGVYLCSAATPPGAGVHGLCGYLAAHLALHDLGMRREPRAWIRAATAGGRPRA